MLFAFAATASKRKYVRQSERLSSIVRCWPSLVGKGSLALRCSYFAFPLACGVTVVTDKKNSLPFADFYDIER